MSSAAASIRSGPPRPIVLALAPPVAGASAEADIPCLGMLGGSPLIERLLTTLRGPGLPPALVVAAPEPARQLRSALPGLEVVSAVGGRPGALRAALDATDEPLLLVHDFERALTPESTVTEVLAGLDEQADAVVPVIPMTDSVKAAPAGRSGGLRNIDRSTLAGVQSPRLLRRTVLERALRDAPQAPDEVLGALEIGARVRTVPGSHSGFAVVDRLSLWQAQISLGLARDTSHRYGLARRS